MFLVSWGFGAGVGALLAHLEGGIAIIPHGIGSGCGIQLLVALPFIVIRWLIHRHIRKRGKEIRKNPPLAFFLGGVAAGFIALMSLVGTLGMRAQSNEILRSDLQRVRAAAEAGQPLPDLNPDDPKYGTTGPLLKFLLNRVKPYAENAAAIRALKAETGTPLAPPAVFDPELVARNAERVQQLQERVALLQVQLEAFAGPRGFAELDRMDINPELKKGYRKGILSSGVTFEQMKASLEASSKVYAQIHKLLGFLQQHPPRNTDGKLSWEDPESFVTYREEVRILQELLADEEAKAIHPPTEKPR